MLPITIHFHNRLRAGSNLNDFCTWVHLFTNNEGFLRTVHIFIGPGEANSPADRLSVQTFNNQDTHPYDPTAVVFYLPAVYS